MAKLDAAALKQLPDSSFAYIDKAGNRKLPIHDKEHTQNAMARWNQTDFDTPQDKAKARSKILAAAKKFGIDVSNFANPLAGIMDNLLSGKKTEMGVIQIETDFSTVVQYESTLV